MNFTQIKTEINNINVENQENKKEKKRMKNFNKNSILQSN